jgi:hypothetical protein
LRYFVVTCVPVISVRFSFAVRRGKAYRFIPLVEVIHIAIQNLNEQLNRNHSAHAGVCYPQCSLEAF